MFDISGSAVVSGNIAVINQAWFLPHLKYIKENCKKQLVSLFFVSVRRMTITKKSLNVVARHWSEKEKNRPEIL